jgi:hypothetical protein
VNEAPDREIEMRGAAGSVEVGTEVGTDVRAAHVGQGREEIARHGVAVRVRGQVPPEPLPERVLAEQRERGVEERAALAVRRIEVRRLEHVLRIDRVRIGPLGGDAVVAQHVVELSHLAHFAAQLRVALVGEPVAEPVRERLVQPEVVPPLERDEVAEPHVRELVRHDLRDLAAVPDGRAADLRQVLRRHHDGGGILHRSEREARDHDPVELPVGVRDPEPLLEARQRASRSHPRRARRRPPRREASRSSQGRSCPSTRSGT